MTDTDHMTLAEQTARRLILAGYTWDHPALVYAREWNAAAYARGSRPAVTPQTAASPVSAPAPPGARTARGRHGRAPDLPPNYTPGPGHPTCSEHMDGIVDERVQPAETGPRSVGRHGQPGLPRPGQGDRPPGARRET